MADEENVITRFFRRLKESGIITTAFLVKNKLTTRNEIDPYMLFIKNEEKDILKTEDYAYRPLFSFVVPVYNVPDNQLEACIESILAQTYDNFELILVDDKSTWESVREMLSRYEDNPKITVIYREQNGHISECTNTGIAAAKGEYIIFTDCDDTVAPDAVYEFTKILNKDKDIDFIYSDEDKLSDDGKVRSDPFFKPDWSPDTLMSIMYTSHLSTYRRSIVNEVGGLRTECNGSQDYDFTLRFTEKTNKIAHVPKVLYHWRQRPGSTSVSVGAKPYVIEALRRLKTEAIERRGLNAEIEYMPEISQFRVIYSPPENALVSIIIPSKDNYDIIERCLTSLDKITKYRNYELIVIDNGSSDINKKKYEDLCSKYNAQYYYEKREFNFPYMCNKGASMAKGDYLLFLNDDIEIIEEKWLENMLGHAALEHAGAVGAKLLYPDSTLIQHDGVINLPGGPSHVFSRMDDNITYSFCRNRLEFNYIAVTAACLCINKDKFYEAGGFDENLAVNYNDVDLCVKLYELGYFNVVRNDAVLYHHESISRGVDTEDPEKMKKLVAERERLYDKHPVLKTSDPFYNVNLTGRRTDFTIDIENSSEADKIVKAGFNAEPYTNNDSVKIYFDRFEQSNMVNIMGWAFVDGKHLNNLNKKYVILVDKDDNSVMFTAKTMLRTDVSYAYGRNNALNLVGFACCIDASLLAPGSYRVGIFLKNMITFKKYAAISDKCIDVR